jgi:hypothetical protein
MFWEKLNSITRCAFRVMWPLSYINRYWMKKKLNSILVKVFHRLSQHTSTRFFFFILYVTLWRQTNLRYLYTVHASREESVSIKKTSRWILYRERMDASCTNHGNYIKIVSTTCGDQLFTRSVIILFYRF